MNSEREREREREREFLCEKVWFFCDETRGGKYELEAL